MTSIEETLKLTTTLLHIKSNFESVQNKYGTKKFMVDLCKNKINELNDNFKRIHDGEWIAIEPDEFTDKPNVFDVGKIQNFYAVATCGKEIEWFSTRHGKSYLENIDKKIKDKKNIQRLFIYKDKQNITQGTVEFIQSNISKGYQVKIIANEEFKKIFWSKFGKSFQNDFGIYGNKLVWEKIDTPEDTSKVNILADDKIIRDYTEVFNKAWKSNATTELKNQDSIINFVNII
jgi:hypothetical protein